MADFNIRSDNVDVEQIMRQIRMRIKEKRGVDYTEEEVRELAGVKLETFLNPGAVRSDLIQHYRRQRQSSPPPENYGFEDETIYESHRGPLRWIRKLLNPLLKLFFNPNPIILVLHRQGKMNDYVLQRIETRDDLNFEVLNNIVLELTRVGIEVKNLRMRIESMGAQQEFNARRARAFEGIVAQSAGGEVAPAHPVKERGAAEGEQQEAVRSKRRRRRRGRRRVDGDAGAGESGSRPHATAPDDAPRTDGTPSSTPPHDQSDPGSDR
jgi:hypothetical protein